MNLIMRLENGAVTLTTQDGQRLTGVCARCGMLWLNGNKFAGDPACQHRKPTVISLEPMPSGPGATLHVQMDEPNGVLHEVINRLAQGLEADNTPGDVLGDIIERLHRVQKQMEVT